MSFVDELFGTIEGCRDKWQRLKSALIFQKHFVSHRVMLMKQVESISGIFKRGVLVGQDLSKVVFLGFSVSFQFELNLCAN